MHGTGAATAACLGTPPNNSGGELEKFGISFKIEARKKILPQAYT
jgi:hypothetical protein